MVLGVPVVTGNYCAIGITLPGFSNNEIETASY